jgi:SAM-dependent methyltransferase
MKERSFDKAYYDRFYRDPGSSVADRQSIALLGDMICAYLKYLRLAVETVLDLGCGLGYWQEVIHRHFPGAAYTGVEVSDYLCRKYGWVRGSVVDYRPRRPVDFVICQGVLQYLDAREARLAIGNLGRLTRGALYLEALTQRDWRQNCHQGVTDGDVYLRDAGFYLRALGKSFVSAGGGLFLHRDSGAVLFDLERGAC